MRKVRNYPREIKSSFLSCEKDFEMIITTLFENSGAFSEDLKRLLVINTKDCLDDYDNEIYNKKLEEMTTTKMLDEGFIVMRPLKEQFEHDNENSFIFISFDKFLPGYENSYFRSHHIMIDILCPINQWELGNYRLRPFKIAGIIDGLLNQTKLSGIGLLNFIGSTEIKINDDMAGYCLIYETINADDDTVSLE